MVPKAPANDYIGRFREILSDPLNLLIERHPLAGTVANGLVYLHNGHRVPFVGPAAYYQGFSLILALNRGVHEPLEEYVFQEWLKLLPPSPAMLELGAYWGHYSMWLKKLRPDAAVHLVEPEPHNLQIGRENFERNGYRGEFVQSFVGRGHFTVDAYLEAKGLARLDALHADIQGYELEMLAGASTYLERHLIDYLFVSTHSQELHREITQGLSHLGYQIEVSADFDRETTSHDGFLLASSPKAARVFREFQPLGRSQITESRPGDL
ncbi:MAG: FkbM family methyltransferase, partial [Planctomycetes bacterium]|nr:FkbM family methyltransferase [Planctomycetota bacterium]